MSEEPPGSGLQMLIYVNVMCVPTKKRLRTSVLENDIQCKHRRIMYAIQMKFCYCEMRRDYIMMQSFSNGVS